MTYSFDWDKLPEDMRLGTAPDEELMLYRGFAPHQFDSERGMLSAAVAYNSLDPVIDVIDAVENGDTERLMEHVVRHAHVAIRDEQRAGELLTPFVSATPERAIAEEYAKKRGERVATVVVRAEQVTIVPLLPYEALVLGSIGLENIVKIEDAPDAPLPRSSEEPPVSALGYTFDMSVIDKLLSQNAAPQYDQYTPLGPRPAN